MIKATVQNQVLRMSEYEKNEFKYFLAIFQLNYLSISLELIDFN